MESRRAFVRKLATGATGAAVILAGGIGRAKASSTSEVNATAGNGEGLVPVPEQIASTAVTDAAVP